MTAVEKRRGWNARVEERMEERRRGVVLERKDMLITVVRKGD